MPVNRRWSTGLLILLAVLFLRVSIGVHFVREAEKKFYGDWTASGFFGAAKGPFAPLFQSLVADYAGFERLCFDETRVKGDRINPQPTLDAWYDYKELVATHYRFGDERVAQQIKAELKTAQDRVAELEKKQAAGGEGWTESDSNELTVQSQRVEELNGELAQLANQNVKADEILEGCKYSLLDTLEQYDNEINNYFNGWESRRNGFERDGDAKSDIVGEVESLTGQQATIVTDMLKARGPWLSEIDGTWNSLETELNALALDRQRSVGAGVDGIEVKIERPSQKTAMLTMIDEMVPYFDLAVGLLLIVGLATRITSLVGSTFLLLIVATQLPGVPGAQDTINQIIEMGGLLVLAAIGGGRFGGLDFFVGRWFGRAPQTPEVGNQ